MNQQQRTGSANGGATGQRRWAYRAGVVVEVVWRAAGARCHRSGDRAGRVLLAARPVRLRQDHDPAADRRLRGDRARRGAHRRRRHAWRAAGEAAGQHRLPELRAVPAQVGCRERGLRPALPRLHQGRGQAPRSARRWSWCGSTVRVAQAAPAVRRPAAARRAWPAHWCCGRRCCCSTSRWARSTPSCAECCRSSCARCTARWASRSCTSRTTRKKR